MRNFAILVLFSMSYLAFSAQDGKNVAKVKLVRGQATYINISGEQGKLAMGDWVQEGAVIKTAVKSFVRLSFIDKSTMNIGPKSELKIEKFGKKEAGVINVLTGKLRAQVTKDYLKMDKDKSKLFVKSKNAVMGVRGTDFMFSTNKKTGNTTTVLFEGSIVFNKLSPGARDLEKIVQAGRMIAPGQVSVAMKNKPKPTIPAKLNTKQFSRLMQNVTLAESKVTKAKKRKSQVPPGLSGEIVASDASNLKKELKKIIKVNVELEQMGKEDLAASKGFIQGNDEKPADGVMIHVETGAVIQPANDAVFDKNTSEWVSTSMGDVNAAGEYIPPENIDITSEGSFVTETADGKLAVIPGMGENIMPVDQMSSFDEAPKVELPPDIAIQVEQDIQGKETEGPSPAGDSVNEAEPIGNETPLIPEELNPTPAPGNLNTGSFCPNCPPPPTGVNTLDPTAGSGTNGPLPPPPTGFTRVKVQVN